MNKKAFIILGVVLGAILIGLLTAGIIWISLHPSVTVTFELNGGTYTETKKEIRYNTEYVIYSPERQNYVFDGWYYENEQINPSGIWKHKKDMTIHAKWKYVDKSGNVFDEIDGALSLREYNGDVLEIIKIEKTKISTFSQIAKGSFDSMKKRAIDKGLNYLTVFVPSSVKVIDESILDDAYYNIIMYDVITEDGFVFYYENNEATLNAYLGSYEKDIVIPESYEGKSVTKIGERVFFGTQHKIKDKEEGFYRINIPESVKYIGKEAFGECINIKPTLYFINKNGAFEEIVDLERVVNWAKKTVVGEGNNYLIDVVTLIRAAIGWSPFSLARIYVTLNANGGNAGEENVILTMNKSYTLPIPVKDNFIFDGWYVGEERVDISGTWKIAAHVTLTARWIENK